MLRGATVGIRAVDRADRARGQRKQVQDEMTLKTALLLAVAFGLILPRAVAYEHGWIYVVAGHIAVIVALQVRAEYRQRQR